MKIYVDSQHRIKALRHNDAGNESLTEIEVGDDFLGEYCDTVKCAFCYHKWIDDDGVEFLSVYPYKDFAVMESIQEQYEINQDQFNEQLETIVDNDYRLSTLELGL